MLETYGCQMNIVDSELVLGGFRKLAFTEALSSDEADVIVLNTCSVRDHAEHRVISRIGALRTWKKALPGRALVVMGCMAQRDAKDIRRRMPHVDLVAGTKDFPRIPELVVRIRQGEGPFVALDGEDRPDVTRDPGSRPRKHQAFVSIMRGCNRPCTYCIVPTVRGRATSRPMEEVVSEVKSLVDDGVVEVCLLGQTVNAYDGGGRGQGNLGTLIRQLESVEGLRRLRFVTSHPQDFSEEIIREMAASTRLDRFLHMPIQSASNRMLKAMRRGYTLEKYLSTVAAIRDAIPDMQFGCDWIVGFPGETEEDHQQSVEVCREIGFSQSFVFKYSPRPGTAAAVLPDDVPEEIKKRRYQDLLAAQAEVSARANSRLIGLETDVLIEGRSRLDQSKWSGRDPAHRIVVLDQNGLAPGMIIRARVRKVTALTLFADLVGKAGP